MSEHKVEKDELCACGCHYSEHTVQRGQCVRHGCDATRPATENDYLVSHPGQCCNGYCVEDFDVHGEESRLAALDAAAAKDVLVSRAITESLAPIVAVLDEYAASCNPGPFTSERALYERLRAVTTPPAGLEVPDAD